MKLNLCCCIMVLVVASDDVNFFTCELNCHFSPIDSARNYIHFVRPLDILFPSFYSNYLKYLLDSNSYFSNTPTTHSTQGVISPLLHASGLYWASYSKQLIDNSTFQVTKNIRLKFINLVYIDKLS